jgi:hypothetical protein
MILFGLANGLTLFEISFVGDRRSGMIISGAIQLTRYSTAISGVGALVALISIIIPALTLALTFSVLVRLISVGRFLSAAKTGASGRPLPRPGSSRVTSAHAACWTCTCSAQRSPTAD